MRAPKQGDAPDAGGADHLSQDPPPLWLSRLLNLHSHDDRCHATPTGLHSPASAPQRKKQKSSTPHTGTQAPGEKQPTTQYNWLSAADVKLSTMTTVRPDTR